MIKKRDRYDYMVQWRTEHLEHIRTERKKWIANHPHYNRDQVRKWRAANPDRQRRHGLQQLEARRQLKQEVLTHYGGGKCACVKCGESRLACLSIDHINGYGNEFRREAETFFNTRASGSALYRWLKQAGYPDGYQTLCMNCQFVKRVENREYFSRHQKETRRTEN